MNLMKHGKFQKVLVRSFVKSEFSKQAPEERYICRNNEGS